MDHGKPGARLGNCDKVSFMEGDHSSPSTKRYGQEVNIKAKKMVKCIHFRNRPGILTYMRSELILIPDRFFPCFFLNPVSLRKKILPRIPETNIRAPLLRTSSQYHMKNREDPYANPDHSWHKRVYFSLCNKFPFPVLYPVHVCTA